MAKYATKAAEDFGLGERRLSGLALAGIGVSAHVARIVRTAWDLGAHDELVGLRRSLHKLGFKGHFATKSRRYSTTPRRDPPRTRRLPPPPSHRRPAHRDRRGSGHDARRRPMDLRLARLPHRRRRRPRPVRSTGASSTRACRRRRRGTCTLSSGPRWASPCAGAGRNVALLVEPPAPAKATGRNVGFAGVAGVAPAASMTSASCPAYCWR
jgi:hypothetical protein